MNFKEYAQECKKTLIYKSDLEMIACSALELSGELTETRKASEVLNRIKELGDICYPLAILTDYYNVEMEDVPNPYDISGNGMGELFLDGIYCIGEIAEIIKKTIRDDSGMLTDTKQRRMRFVYLTRSLFTMIRDYCSDKEINFSDVLSMNVEKLQSRMERGVVSGDGDHR